MLCRCYYFFILLFCFSFLFFFFFFFFFQAEDGIRDLTVTGVQTCALPIFGDILKESLGHEKKTLVEYEKLLKLVQGEDVKIGRACVGKECRSRWSPYH